VIAIKRIFADKKTSAIWPFSTAFAFRHKLVLPITDGFPGERPQAREELLQVARKFQLVAVKTSPVPSSHGKLEDTAVAWGTIEYEGKQAMIVASKQKSGVEKASFDAGERTVELQKGPPDEPKC
jgi:hypothetical protein